MKEESAQAKALRRRLAADELTPEDQRRLRHTEIILAGRAAGKTMEMMATEAGEKRNAFGKFARGGIYRVLAEHLRNLEVTEDEGAAEAAVTRTRTELKSMSPHVREYVAWAARKRLDGTPGYEDPGAAMWAAQYLAKANGLDTAERATRPTINIHVDTIQAITGSIKKDLDAAVRSSGAAIEAVAEVVTDALDMENGA